MLARLPDRALRPYESTELAPTRTGLNRFPLCKDPRFPVDDNAGGLNGSVQHLLAVYVPEFEIPKFFWDADLKAARLCRGLLENRLTSLFV